MPCALPDGLKAVWRNLKLFWQLSASTEFPLTKTKGLFGADRGAHCYQTAAQAIMKGLIFGGRKSKLAQGWGSHSAQLHQKETFTEERWNREMEFCPYSVVRYGET